MLLEGNQMKYKFLQAMEVCQRLIDFAKGLIDFCQKGLIAKRV